MLFYKTFQNQKFVKYNLQDFGSLIRLCPTIRPQRNQTNQCLGLAFERIRGQNKADNVGINIF